MNFLFDENFPQAAKRPLFELGHRIIDIRGSELQGIEDRHLFNLGVFKTS